MVLNLYDSFNVFGRESVSGAILGVLRETISEPRCEGEAIANLRKQSQAGAKNVGVNHQCDQDNTNTASIVL